MAKIDINKVAEILKRNEIDPKLLRQIIEELNALAQTEAGEDKPLAVKKQFAILVSDPEGVLPKEELAGWVLQLPESESVETVEERVYRGAYDYNATRKGRQYPVKTVGEAIEQVPAKIFKETDLWVKTKTPVLMLRTNNKIPREPKQSD
jgi:hypothetical protein